MNSIPYTYRRTYAEQYTFFSMGKRPIEKVVEFVPIGINNIMNVAFGDLLPDGRLDDRSDSNNGDIIRVLTTVIAILKDFTEERPYVEIFFTGSTIERTNLYARILRRYYIEFKDEFSISALIGTDQDNRKVTFDPVDNLEYFAFLIKRK